MVTPVVVPSVLRCSAWKRWPAGLYVKPLEQRRPLCLSNAWSRLARMERAIAHMAASSKDLRQGRVCPWQSNQGFEYRAAAAFCHSKCHDLAYVPPVRGSGERPLTNALAPVLKLVA